MKSEVKRTNSVCLYLLMIHVLVCVLKYTSGRHLPLQQSRSKREFNLRKKFGLNQKLTRDIKLRALKLRKLLANTDSIIDREKLFFDDIMLMPRQMDALFHFHIKSRSDRSVEEEIEYVAIDTEDTEGSEEANAPIFVRKRPKCKTCGSNPEVGPTSGRKGPMCETCDSNPAVGPKYERKGPIFLFNVKKWRMPITYIISDEYGRAAKVVQDAISHIQQHTCIRFKKLQEGIRIQERHVYFSTRLGCGSQVGRTNSFGPQFINIGSCQPIVGVIVHEICHCLGLLHEQTRTDAEEHVNIIRENIIKGEEVNFHSFPEDKIKFFRTPYDYNSVMHYNKFSVSINSKTSPTIVTKDQLYEKNIGQNTGLSFYDRRALNRIYCKGVCKKKLSCKRFGFPDPNSCTKCVCNDGFGGKLCQMAGPSHAKCSPNQQNIIRVTSSIEKCLESPGYNSEGYKPFDECNWYLKSRKGSRISLSFKGSFSVYCVKTTQTCFHWVEIKFRERLVNPGPRFCCYTRPSVSLVSDKHEVVISFRSSFEDGIIEHSELGGFKLCYKLHETKK